MRKPLLIAPALFLLVTAVSPTAQQPNPTPIVVTLTPAATATLPAPPTPPSPTPPPAVPPDRFEPNDAPEQAAPIGLQPLPDLTLVDGDVDYFALYLQAGQTIRIDTAVSGTLDTRLALFWQGALAVENDDRAPADAGSAITWTAAADGTVLLRVAQATAANGRYALTAALIPPTPTLTPSPTPTQTPTATPTAVPLPSAYPLPSAAAAPPSAYPLPSAAAAPSPTATAVPTASRTISLTIQPLGRVTPETAVPATAVRLLVYYDANNDRAPGPGEGVPNVSVLAVDAQGQPLARVFTNAQGEAFFNLVSPALDRVMVPFVPGWSARIRPGEADDDLVLGLPAVRLPVFLPVLSDEVEE